MLAGQSVEALERVTVERGDLYMDVRRRRYGWEMHSPFAAQVDQAAVARWLDAVEGASVLDRVRFSEMGRRGVSLRDFGLAPPVARVTFHGEGWSSMLLVGQPGPMGKEVFVRDAGLEEVWAVPEALAARLPGRVDDWRARELVAGDRARLRVLEIKAPGRPFVRLSKETGAWRLLQPADEPADDRKVEALLDALYAARVVRFVWPSVQNVSDLLATDAALKARMEVYGLGAETALQVTVQEAAGAEPCKVAFGNRCDGEESLRYVLMSGGGTVGAVSNAVFEAFLGLPSDLRDLRLFAEALERVRRVEAAVGDGLLFVLTQKDALWQMESPVAVRMDQVRFAAALGRLLNLTAESTEARSGEPEHQEPVSRVEVQTDGGVFKATFSRAGEHLYQVTMTNRLMTYHVAASNAPLAFLEGAALLDLCDKAMLSLPDGAIRRVSVKRPDGSGESLQREGGAGAGWRAVGEAREIDAGALEAFIAKASRLVAERIEAPLAAAAGADPYAFRTPWLEITLDVDSADAIRKTVIIGKEAPEGGRYAAIRGQDIGFVLGEETLAVLQRPLVGKSSDAN